MFKGAKKEDLRRIASELELCVIDKLTVLDLMDLIKTVINTVPTTTNSCCSDQGSRKVVHNCVICCKANPTCTDQITADLPKDRVIKNYPFNVSAVHLDIVTDLTSNAFIATLKRFIFRRGKCAELHSDNATNFVSANIELKKMFNLVCKPDEALASYVASEGIDWICLPPEPQILEVSGRQALNPLSSI
ncbi:integrase catalytic domain-containing protein [Trichonephila clavipes]|nr:integrase catalytic domain-containing protein [Trichonephila clavipes]